MYYIVYQVFTGRQKAVLLLSIVLQQQQERTRGERTMAVAMSDSMAYTLSRNTSTVNDKDHEIHNIDI